MSDDVIFCSVHGASSPANIGCIACDRERQRKLESLRAKLAGTRQAIGLLTTLAPSMEIDANDPVGMAREIVRVVSEKDKRIEELEQQLAYAHRCPFCTTDADEDHIITDEQIDVAWRMADEDHVDSLSVVATFGELGINCCKKCGGSGLWPPPQPAQDEPCPGCQGHGWIRKEHGYE